MTPLTLPTTFTDIVLRRLGSDDAGQWIDLVERNRAHLTEFGDDTLPPHTVEEFDQWLSDPEDLALRMGIWRGKQLIGFVELSHLRLAIGGEELLLRSPNGFVLGYWIGSEFTGKGYTTAACRSLIEHVRATFGVTEFWSSARHGNAPSMAVLERLGFAVYQKGSDSVGYRLAV